MINHVILGMNLILSVTIILLLIYPSVLGYNGIRIIALIGSLVVSQLSMLLLLKYDYMIYNLFQFVHGFPTDSVDQVLFLYGLDAISLSLIILTTFITSLCLLISYVNITYRITEYYILLLLSELLLINVFSVLDLLYFYIFFESILIPLFILIGVYGSHARKIYAALLFFIYTLLSSLFTLLLISFLFRSSLLSTSYYFLITETTIVLENKLWALILFLPFAVKLPMWPFHIWLPEAHSEAPTAGSVLLAGVLLKMAGYGMLRFLLPMFPTAVLYFSPVICTLALISIIYGSLAAIVQTDFKKLIAYSSIAHMNYSILGLVSHNIQGIQGAIFIMISHGLVSSGLFICVGYIYDRYQTRTITYLGGLSQVYPKLATYFFILVLANMAIPGTSSFVGETLVLMGAITSNFGTIVVATIFLVLTAPYSLWLYSRLYFGPISPNVINEYSDLNRRESFALFSLTVLVLVLGIKPTIVLNFLEQSILNILFLQII